MKLSVLDLQGVDAFQMIGEAKKKKTVSNRQKLHCRVRHFYPCTEKCILRLTDTNLEYSGKTLVVDRASLYLHILAANLLCNSQMRSDWRKPVFDMKVKTISYPGLSCVVAASPWNENLDGWRSGNKKPR
ncbi:hypothetical protein AVEN_203374-1 [Araneus ventricosus]|uniref:Uncharacterized protein n=1 Tax=Araneus ventricosus TaxID=182803 RepID=A0A4Y2UAY8_ARAVE|nr:hypothetical protein AVEN_203374-1 [Araneus ventricosus]